MSSLLRPLWLRIKSYQRQLRIAGGCTFAISLVLCVPWMLGRDVEPIVALLGLLSTVLIGAPDIATYFEPDPKHLRDMTLDEILSYISTTSPTDDWRAVSIDEEESTVCREFPSLRFRIRISADGVHQEKFVEPWANKHPDPSATSYYCDLLSDGNLIDRRILVSVDGARAMLPLPSPGTKRVRRHDYAVACIVDRRERVDEYMKRAGLEIADS